jgi:DNA-binding NarL/FixJ family response regulator/Tfp pilus assembly protein PilZ
MNTRVDFNAETDQHTAQPSVAWGHPPQRLVLLLEFDDAAGFRANYLSDLANGGVRIRASMEVGQRFFLSISFPKLVAPLLIEGVVRWSLSAIHPDGPSAGLAFIDPSPEATASLADALDASTQAYRIPLEPPHRVLLLEAQPFLREIYGQEVRNWAELRGEKTLELVAIDDVAAWLAEVTSHSATIGIIDVDGLPTTGVDLYKQVRAKAVSTKLPLIVLGSPANVEPVSAACDELLRCLCKPLMFGVLMKTMRMLARDAHAQESDADCSAYPRRKSNRTETAGG